MSSSGVKHIKKSDLPQPVAESPLTSYQIGLAKVESQNAIKQLAFYGANVKDTEFQKFLKEQIRNLYENHALFD